MRDVQPSDLPGKEPPGTELSMERMWDEAAKEFERICGESLQRGEVKSFNDVQAMIEKNVKPSYGEGPSSKWEKAKSVGLSSLKFMKMLVGAATQASALVRQNHLSLGWSSR